MANTPIRPIPDKFGVGFTSQERLPEYAEQYREEQVGRYWNYYVTPDRWQWPERTVTKKRGPYVIDAFSPNLNKSLHVGHLRQLALARSLRGVLGHDPGGKFVALLGAGLGVYKYAKNELDDWFSFVGYNPEIYYDVLMPRDEDIVPRHKVQDPESHHDGAEVWYGPKGPVVVVRSDGRPTYAFHDIAFAKTVAPTHYITGAEQKEHFENLGLGEQHLSMGLVLGPDGKKMKSRTGDSVSAAEVLSEIEKRLDPSCPEPRKLAWNVLAWNFLHTARSQNVKYDPVEWTKPDSPGLYITYTFARLRKAMKGLDGLWFEPAQRKACAWSREQDKPHFEPQQEYFTELPAWSKAHPDPYWDLTQADADLLGYSDYYQFYLDRAIDTLDPVQVANFAHDLARKLGIAYHTEKIQGGRYGFQHAVHLATSTLRNCLWSLGMFDLETV